nr:MAG TPA: excisionase [Caudoviricetes sp.]
MSSQPIHPHTPDAITLRQAETLTGINYKTIHAAAMQGHIHWARYNTVPTFRVSQHDTIKWAHERSC